MDRAFKRSLVRSAKQTSVYIVVVGIAFILIFPMFFLFSFSFMSDYETYSEWPKPMLPSFRAEFSITSDSEGYHLKIYNKSEGDFANFGPLSFSADDDSLLELSKFIKRQSNCRISVEELKEQIDVVNLVCFDQENVLIYKALFL